MPAENESSDDLKDDTGSEEDTGSENDTELEVPALIGSTSTLEEIVRATLEQGKVPEGIDLRKELKLAMKRQQEREFLRAMLVVEIIWLIFAAIVILSGADPDLTRLLTVTAVLSVLLVGGVALKVKTAAMHGSGKSDGIELSHRKL